MSGSFTAFPGAGPHGTLFLEAFGQLSRHKGSPGDVATEQDLYSVFMARAELMSWSTHAGRSSSPRFAGVWERPLLWGMNEAELTAGTDSSRIGYAQVGLEAGVEAAMVLPALVQCFDDALGRFGLVDLSGLQVTASYLPRARPCAGNLISLLNWFHAAPRARVGAVIALDDGLLPGGTEEELVASLQGMYTGPFEFGPLVAVPRQDSIEVRWDPVTRLGLSAAQWGVSVALPEWTASAAAWALAMVIDAARSSAPGVRHFAVRVARSRVASPESGSQ